MNKTEEMTINEELVLLDITAEDNLIALEEMGMLLYKQGYVKETYLKAIQEREKIYPTGLPTASVGVAIPHTDSEHVISPAVAIGILKNGVTFQMMGSPDDKVHVELIFMLAIKKPEMQITMLQKLMSIFQKEELLLQLKTLKDTKTVIAVISKELNSEDDGVGF